MFFVTDKFKIEKWEREKKLDRLIKTFKKNNNEDIRIMVIQSLGRIGGDTAFKFLIESLKDASSIICKEIIVALGNIGNQKSIPALVKILDMGTPDIQKLVVQTLSKLEAKSAINPLIKLLKVNDTSLKLEAIKALGSTPSEKSIPHLVKLLNNEDEEIQKEVNQAIEIIRKFFVMPHFEKLRSESPEVREQAARDLGLTKDPLAVDSLIESLDDEDPNVIVRAIEALSEIEDHRVVQPIVGCLRKKSHFIREHAAVALKKIKWKPGKDEDGARYYIILEKWNKCLEIGQAAVEPLIEFLFISWACGSYKRQRDMDIYVVQLLAKLKDKRAVGPLLDILAEWWNKGDEVAIAIIETLGKIGDKKAIEALLSALDYTTSPYGDYPPDRIANEAAASLKKLTGKNFGNSKEKWSKWWKEN